MAWNQSNGAAAKPQPKKPSAMRGVVAGVVCAAIAAAVVLFVLSGKDAKPKVKAEKEAELIPEVKPAVKRMSPTNNVMPVAAVSQTNSVPQFKTPEEERLWHIHHPAFTNKASRWNTSRSHRIFHNSIDRRLGALLDLRPGETLVGDSELLFRQDFTKRFLKSLEEPIIVSKDDSPEDAALKRAVIATKIELKDHYDAGEDIRELMIKTRKDMQNLALYRKDLELEIKKIAADRTMTEDEMNTVLKKANDMLSERGAAPLSMPRFAAQRFELLRQKGSAQKGAAGSGAKAAPTASIKSPSPSAAK